MIDGNSKVDLDEAGQENQLKFKRFERDLYERHTNPGHGNPYSQSVELEFAVKN